MKGKEEEETFLVKCVCVFGYERGKEKKRVKMGNTFYQKVNYDSVQYILFGKSFQNDFKV